MILFLAAIVKKIVNKTFHPTSIGYILATSKRSAIEKYVASASAMTMPIINNKYVLFLFVTSIVHNFNQRPTTVQFLNEKFMNPVETTYQGSVAIITMKNGENRHNPAFAKAMLEALKKVELNSESKALIITSDDEKSFSLGIDTDWLMPAMKTQKFDEIKGFMRDMDDVFKRLLLFPMPVIAAINGHAFGNGAILTCACDFRFMLADKGFFCFPEVDLSIPFLPGMIEFVKKAIPYHRFNEMKLSGRRVSGRELENDNVIEKAYDSKELLMEGALNYAQTFDKKRAIFGEHKKRLHKHIIDTIDTQNKPLIASLSLMV